MGNGAQLRRQRPVVVGTGGISNPIWTLDLKPCCVAMAMAMGFASYSLQNPSGPGFAEFLYLIFLYRMLPANSGCWPLSGDNRVQNIPHR